MVTLLLAGADPSAEGGAHEVVVSCLRAHGGQGPVGRDDVTGLLAVFSRPSDALACAVAILRSLADTAAGPAMPIALHTGELELDDAGGHFADSVTRCARLRDLAYAGQILVSNATAELVVDRLPPDTSLQDLGRHVLRGLARPERVSQLRHPDLVADFPPLGASSDRHNLPPQLTSFVGRTRELATLAEVLTQNRAVTLTGAGGCGKTRLALQVAGERLDDFTDGVWWVDLGPIADAELVATTTASVLNVREVPTERVDETLTRQLADRQLLLVLDNCEHLLSTCAGLTDRLLRSCPGVVVLTTSREPLGIAGELVWRVASLPYPADDAPTAVLELTGYDAVLLFVERATRVRPNFRLTDDNAPHVALVCRRLDGIPLAIELAAAHVRVLSPRQIADKLIDSFALMTGAQRGTLSRQQTLEASVDWSYNLLTADEQAVLARLSVFAGGFPLEGAEVVCAGGEIEAYRVLDLLSRLVDKSLVQVDDDLPSRYRLLETIRYFAGRHLADRGGIAETRDRHLSYFSKLAAEEEAELESFGWGQALRRLSEENDNLRAAIRWGLQANDAEPVLGIVGDLYQYWRIRGHFAEGLAWAQSALARPAPDSVARRDAYLGASGLSAYTADFATAATWANEAMRVARALDDRKGIGRALNALAFPTMYLDPPARGLYEDAITIHREQGDALYLAASLFGLAYLEINAGNLVAARRCAEESVEVARQVGGIVERLGGLNFLGWAASAQGDFAVAVAAFVELIAAAHELGESFWDSLALAQLAGIAVWTGDYERASGLLGDAVRFGRESANIYTLGASLWYLGELAYAQGDLEAAVAPLEEALPLLLVTPHNWVGAIVQARLGDVAAALGDESAAADAWHAAMEHARRSANAVALGRAQQGLARESRGHDDPHRAEELVHAALAGYLTSGDRPGAVTAIEDLAALAADLESWTEAARLVAAANAARRTIGFARGHVAVVAHEALVERVREQLGDDALAAAWADGEGLSLDGAAAYASKRRGSRKRPSAGWSSLTPMELQVAHLVAEGLTNPAIAERLFITRGTVKVHLSHIFSKLGLTNRTELAAVTIRRAI